MPELNEYGIYPYLYLLMGPGGNFLRIGWLSIHWTSGYFVREAKKKAAIWHWECGDWLIRVSWGSPYA